MGISIQKDFGYLPVNPFVFYDFDGHLSSWQIKAYLGSFVEEM